MNSNVKVDKSFKLWRCSDFLVPGTKSLNQRQGLISASRIIALFLLPPILLVLAVLYIVVVAAQGRPFIYSSERMNAVDRSFRLYKIRTMHPPDPDADERVLCGNQAKRVTTIGRFLRRSRLDELPQIFNVLKGDIRFVGPRPPLRRYVEAYPELYADVLRGTLPGITGLATVLLHQREERLLANCMSATEADAVYRRRCIPIKARLDLIHKRNNGVRLNTMILARTLARVFSGAWKDIRNGGGATLQRVLRAATEPKSLVRLAR